MNDLQAIEQALIAGDLSKLTAPQRLEFYNKVCESLDLNPLTKPFAYITLNGKLTLYAMKDCTEQLRSKRGISLKITAREVVEDCYVVTAQASHPEGRQDESIGAVPIASLKGEAKANAMMKAETKAKRRVTLSICGLGLLDESEVGSIPTATVHEEAPKLDAPAAKPNGEKSVKDMTPEERYTAASKLLKEAATVQDIKVISDQICLRLERGTIRPESGRPLYAQSLEKWEQLAKTDGERLHLRNTILRAAKTPVDGEPILDKTVVQFLLEKLPLEEPAAT